jgi:hypothetical protein
VAAGQDQSKKQQPGKQAHAPPSPHHQSKVQHLPQQQSAKLQTVISRTPPPAGSLPQQPTGRSLKISTNTPTSPIPVSVESVNAQPPTVSPTPQPQIKTEAVPTLPVRPSQQQLGSTSPISSSSEAPKTKAPVLPSRVQSQTSVTRPVVPIGPPPAIPPRTAPVRAGSVQVTSPGQVRPLRRQSSISAMPACLPQAPPPFFIPQRKQSISSNNGGSNGGSGSPKRST